MPTDTANTLTFFATTSIRSGRRTAEPLPSKAGREAAEPGANMFYNSYQSIKGTHKVPFGQTNHIRPDQLQLKNEGY